MKIKGYFCYEKNMGRWSPTVYYDRPEKGPNSRTVERTPLIEIELEERGGPPDLDALKALYPAPVEPEEKTNGPST